ERQRPLGAEHAVPLAQRAPRLLVRQVLEEVARLDLGDGLARDRRQALGPRDEVGPALGIDVDVDPAFAVLAAGAQVEPDRRLLRALPERAVERVRVRRDAVPLRRLPEALVPVGAVVLAEVRRREALRLALIVVPRDRRRPRRAVRRAAEVAVADAVRIRE